MYTHETKHFGEWIESWEGECNKYSAKSTSWQIFDGMLWLMNKINIFFAYFWDVEREKAAQRPQKRHRNWCTSMQTKNTVTRNRNLYTTFTCAFHYRILSCFVLHFMAARYCKLQIALYFVTFSIFEYSKRNAAILPILACDKRLTLNYLLHCKWCFRFCSDVLDENTTNTMLCVKHTRPPHKSYAEKVMWYGIEIWRTPYQIDIQK